MGPTLITLMTAPNPGAIAIVQLHGAGAAAMLRDLTATHDWPPGRVRFVSLAGIDDGCAVLLRDGSQGMAQVMPHGGLRVVQKLIDALVDRNCTYCNEMSTRELYPEATNDLEADMLAALARAASPAAIDLLLAQPDLWRNYGANRVSEITHDQRDVIALRSQTLDRLIDAPCVVVVGRPNVGKSTLTNRLMGRSASLVADLPGTTRDWVGGLVELSPRPAVQNPESAVAVRWLDTPGLRDSDDPIEQRAIELARQVVGGADVLIAMRDADCDWPDPSGLPGAVDLHVVNKSDLSNVRRDNDPADVLHVSALTGEGLDELQGRILDRLALSEISSASLWAFSPRLRDLIRTGDAAALRAYADL